MRARFVALAGLLWAFPAQGARTPSGSASSPSEKFPLSDRDVAALKGALDDIVAKTALQHTRLSIEVMNLDDGRVLYARDADALLNPASNVKLFTAAAALSRLGPEFRWTTEFLTVDPLKNGEVKDLWVKGNGDPLLTTEKLYAVVGQLQHLGLKTITGNIYVDDTAFDADRNGPGFDQETGDKSYLAPTGALSLNWNTIEINVWPGKAVGDKARTELEPDSEFFQVENKATTIREDQRGRVTSGFTADGDKVKLKVDGRLPIDKPGIQIWRKIDRPDMYFGYSLKALLAERGIKVKGKVKRGTTPGEAKVLYTADADPLDLAVRKMDKISSNFIAEQVLKTLGMELKGAPGTWAKGTEAVEDFLEEVGIPRGSFVMKNGSGLNDTNRFSAAQLCKVVRFMARRFGASPEFLSSLGIAGKDGTVRGRMEGTEAAGRLRAKTGTLEGTTALSGVVESAVGAHLVFSIIVNDILGKHSAAVQGVDAIGVALASAGSLDAATVTKLVSAPAASPIEELRARVTTYQSLGKLHSSYNLPFLRTALQTERDPAIRAAIAEAIFQSRKKDPKPDPQVEKTLVEAWSNGPEVFGRLKSLAKDFNGEVPVVGALLDVAAGGQPEAIAHVIGLASLAKDDPQLTVMLGDGLDQISRNAPDELLAAMKAAPPIDSSAALDLLTQGNAASTEAQPTPFPKAIEKAKTGKNVELASYAKTLETDYAARLATAKANPRPKPADPVKAPDAPTTPPK